MMHVVAGGVTQGLKQEQTQMKKLAVRISAVAGGLVAILVTGGAWGGFR
jgi:hypothetical protein